MLKRDFKWLFLYFVNLISSSGYQCVTINSKSDYVLEIKFGKISYESASSVKCGNDEDMHEHDYISQEYVYVDTNYGVKCPLKTGVYEKLNPKVSNHQKHQRFSSNSGSSEYSLSSSQSLSSSTANEPCKYLTQTQTLQVGCQNEQQYSLRTKLCYPNHQYNGRQYNDAATSADQPKQQPHHHHNQQQPTTTAYTQLESEINLVCLAHWRHNNHHVIVSRTMSNEILCSVKTSTFYFFPFHLPANRVFFSNLAFSNPTRHYKNKPKIFSQQRNI